MKGRLTIIPTTGAVSSKELAAPPHLEDLTSGVGGHIEVVPHFTSYEDQPCIALCNEDGHRLRMPINRRASDLWHECTAFTFNRDEVLVGPIVIVTGDRELMEEL